MVALLLDSFPAQNYSALCAMRSILIATGGPLVGNDDRCLSRTLLHQVHGIMKWSMRSSSERASRQSVRVVAACTVVSFFSLSPTSILPAPSYPHLLGWLICVCAADPGSTLNLQDAFPLGLGQLSCHEACHGCLSSILTLHYLDVAHFDRISSSTQVF